MKAMRWSQGLFFLNAAIWLVLGIVSVVRLAGSAGQGVTAVVVAVLMFGNAGAMALSGALLGKRLLLFYLFALAVLVVNIVLTFTDQVGALDWFTFAIDLVLVGILIGARKHFLGGRRDAQGRSRTAPTDAVPGPTGRMDNGGGD